MKPIPKEAVVAAISVRGVTNDGMENVFHVAAKLVLAARDGM
jgi:hypothetical protein